MSMNDTLNRFVNLIPLTEGSGDKYYKDSQGYITAPYGVLADPKKSSAYKKNKQVAADLGYDIDSLTAEQAREVAIALAAEMDSQLSRTVPNYDELPTPYKVFMLDAKFNTGDTYKTFAKKAAAYEASGSKEDFEAMIAETSRTEGGKRTEGMDNRSAKVLLATGIASSLDSLQSAGLSKATKKANVPSEFMQDYTESEQKATQSSGDPVEDALKGLKDDGVFTGDEYGFFLDDIDSLIEQLESETGITTESAQKANEQALMEEELLRAVEAEMAQMEMPTEPEMTEFTLPPSMQVQEYTDFDKEYNEDFYDPQYGIF